MGFHKLTKNIDFLSPISLMMKKIMTRKCIHVITLLFIAHFSHIISLQIVSDKFYKASTNNMKTWVLPNYKALLDGKIVIRSTKSRKEGYLRKLIHVNMKNLSKIQNENNIISSKAYESARPCLMLSFRKAAGDVKLQTAGTANNTVQNKYATVRNIKLETSNKNNDKKHSIRINLKKDLQEYITKHDGKPKLKTIARRKIHILTRGNSPRGGDEFCPTPMPGDFRIPEKSNNKCAFNLLDGLADIENNGGNINISKTATFPRRDKKTGQLLPPLSEKSEKQRGKVLSGKTLIASFK